MTDRYLMEEHARIAKVGAVHPNRPRRG